MMSTLLDQKGVHLPPWFDAKKGLYLENEKMRQQSRQEDQNASRHIEKPLGSNGRYTVLALTSVLEL